MDRWILRHLNKELVHPLSISTCGTSNKHTSLLSLPRQAPRSHGATMIRPKSSHDYHKPAEREEEKIDGELAKVIASDLQTFKTVEGMD